MLGINGGEFVVLALVALFLLGPERLPGLARQAARALHDIRRWTTRTRADLTKELGPEFENFDLAELNPKNFVKKHLLDPLEDDDEDEPVGARRAGHTLRTAAARDGALDGAAPTVSLATTLPENERAGAGDEDGAWPGTEVTDDDPGPDVGDHPADAADAAAGAGGADLAESPLGVPAWGDTASAAAMATGAEVGEPVGAHAASAVAVADREAEPWSTEESDNWEFDHLYFPPAWDTEST